MASEAAVKRSLQAIGNMFGKGSWWVKDSTKMWQIQLSDIPDEVLFEGVKNCLRKAKKCPTVANVRSIIEADPRNNIGEVEKPEGCRACQGTGMREMARWYFQDNKQRVFRGVAACDCAAGRRLQVGPFEDWRDVMAAWEKSGSIEIFYTTHDHPVLTDEQRCSPEIMERRKQQDENSDRKSSGAWQRLVDK